MVSAWENLIWLLCSHFYMVYYILTANWWFSWCLVCTHFSIYSKNYCRCEVLLFAHFRTTTSLAENHDGPFACLQSHSDHLRILKYWICLLRILTVIHSLTLHMCSPADLQWRVRRDNQTQADSSRHDCKAARKAIVARIIACTTMCGTCSLVDWISPPIVWTEPSASAAIWLPLKKTAPFVWSERKATKPCGHQSSACY